MNQPFKSLSLLREFPSEHRAVKTYHRSELRMKHQISVVIDQKRIGVNAELKKRRVVENDRGENELDISARILAEVSLEYRRRRHRVDSFCRSPKRRKRTIERRRRKSNRKIHQLRWIEHRLCDRNHQIDGLKNAIG